MSGSAIRRKRRQRLTLELTYALGRDAVPLADVGELLLTSVEQAVASSYDVGLSLTEVVDQRRDELARLVVEHGEVRTG